jgi:hydrogenase maturation protease
MSGRVVVAGLGNVFLGDDGFGVEVVRRLADRPLPSGVELADIGIRGVHLAFELLDGVELLILIDAAERGEAPGTVSVIEVEQGDEHRQTPAPEAGFAPLMDAHDMGPDAVLGLLDALGGRAGRTIVVTCEPERSGPGIGLSSRVQAAVDVAADAVIARLPGGDRTHPEEESDVGQSGQGDRAGRAGGGDHPVHPGPQALPGNT